MTKITEKDRGYRRLVEQVFGFENPKVSVGILSAEGSQKDEDDDRVTVLDKAIWNEFGTENIPSRSFVRAWFDSNLPEIKKKLQGLMIQVIKGRISKDHALEQLGAWMVGSMQKRISSQIPPPNAPSTVKAKGSSTPLIDHGQLRSSISYKVES